MGGILRGGTQAVELYARIFAGPARLEITFSDIVEYAGTDHVVYAGRETGHYSTDDLPVPIAIRTTRYLRRENGNWAQYHHHGSIDDPAALSAYQQALS